MKKIIFPFFYMVLSACSVPLSMMPEYDSDADTSKRGFGYTVRTLGEDYYEVKYTAKAISALDSYKNAWLMWEMKASEICKMSDYKVYDKAEKKWTDHMPGWLQTVNAELDCTGEARENMRKHIAAEKEIKKKEIAELAKINPCLDANATKKFSEIGFDFYREKYYEEAMQCFLKSLESENYNSDVVLHIGMMYEFGQGVQIDIEKAKYWYAKMR